ncbi:MAG: hypothetical protein ABSD72_04275 [Terracidiphilus sp.]|jgi:hypothetical protein
MSAATQNQAHATLTEAEKISIREQLARLLENPFFSHSKRFPTFLRFVTEETLAGREDDIKERTLGIEIFGRDPDYDTASDPIVRVTAAEIRKRVAQYYQDPAHVNELRIALPSGSYIPKFHWPKGADDPVLKEMDLAAAETLSDAQSVAGAALSRRHSHLVLALTCVCAAILSAGSVFLWQSVHHSALDFFWGPILKAREPVLLCTADQLQYSSLSLRDAAEPTRQVVLSDNLTAVVMDDVYAIVKVAGVLQSSGKQYTIKSEGATNLDDLRSGPTVFIGAFDNAWTLRLTNSLRFHFANNADMTRHEIVDSTNPGQTSWVVDRSLQMATHDYRDYAILARFTDTNTGRPTVIVAGISRGGTIVAGEFLTDPGDLAQLQRLAQAAGDKKNMEIVLSTQIIDEKPGSPKIEAAYFW